MSESLCFFCCQNFLAEVVAALSAESLSDVVAVGFPVRCGRPPIDWEELRPMLPEGCSQVILLGRACMNGLGEVPDDFPPTRIHLVEQCFHLVAGNRLVDELITSGGYLITPHWLKDWRGHLAQMGFPPEQAGEFFQDFSRELVLLDTGTGADSQTLLDELAHTVNLPVRSVPVGVDYTHALLVRMVLEWRLETLHRSSDESNRHHTAELADHQSAMDMLSNLAKALHESEAIEAISDLFRMLFAPEILHYLRVENDVSVPQGKIPPEILAALEELKTDFAWSADGKGFLLQIGTGAAVLGKMAVERLAYPQYRERYLNMALAMTGVCGLAIESARNRRRLLEAEKMASLGILVAGVAHEINTPVGVGLAAASALQAQSSHLAKLFAERSMTQSDLTHYLATANSSSSLVLSNLQRIGQLIDAFRQVAVEGKPLQKHVFRLKDFLDDVIHSLGDRLPTEHFTVDIQCDPDLEIESLASDWASIFVNLLGNSLRHGFKGRTQGRIDIRVEASPKRLRVDYHDDGNGMNAESLARIFDPFYSTDLQHGMGLGMHLVYNLITHRLGGTIQCDSRTGEGVHFRIDIPR